MKPSIDGVSKPSPAMGVPMPASGYSAYPGGQPQPQPHPLTPPIPQIADDSSNRRPSLGDLRVTCPLAVMVLRAANGGVQFLPLKVQRMTFDTLCQISTAFITFEAIVFWPPGISPAPMEILMPKSTQSTITELVVQNLMRDSIYTTAVIPTDDAVKHGFKPAVTNNLGSGATQADDDPELFRLALPSGAQPGEQLRVRITYFEPLEFAGGVYSVRLPTCLPESALMPGQRVQDVLEVTLSLNTGMPLPVSHLVTSGHTFEAASQAPGKVTLRLSKGAASTTPNADVVAGYQVWGNDMLISLNVQPPGSTKGEGQYSPDPPGTFILTMAPPAPERTQHYVRSVIFALDRSGSMSGVPMRSAKDALVGVLVGRSGDAHTSGSGKVVCWGLSQLQAYDEFSVVAFDHEQLWFSPTLAQATPEAVQQCIAWVHSLEARGGTNIMAPLQTAFGVLQAAKGLPSVFLITDGCVSDEREIVGWVEGVVRASLQAGQPVPRGLPRVSTFAIGAYANHFFLKLLATTGRGNFDVAFRSHSIQAQIKRMLLAMERPVLSDLTLSIPAVRDVELYPYPIPDLFCGMPLVLAGKYNGTWPETVQLNGRLPDGTAWASAPVRPCEVATQIPLDKVFIKGQLDLLTARAWMANGARQSVDQVVSLSVAQGVPCAYTRMVGFETTGAKYNQLQAQRASGRLQTRDYMALAVGGAAGIAVVAGAVALLSFGDLAGTVANAGVFDALGGAFGDGGDACCACCGDGCGDCGCGDGGCCGGDCGGCDGCDCGECDLGDLCDGLGDMDCAIQ